MENPENNEPVIQEETDYTKLVLRIAAIALPIFIIIVLFGVGFGAVYLPKIIDRLNATAPSAENAPPIEEEEDTEANIPENEDDEEQNQEDDEEISPEPQQEIGQPRYLTPTDITPDILPLWFYVTTGYIPDRDPEMQKGDTHLEIDAEFQADAPLFYQWGWCTSDSETLENNFENIKIVITFDGEEMPADKLFFTDQENGDGTICRNVIAMMEAWPEGDHILRVDIIFVEPLDDGIMPNPYPAATHTEEFSLKITPGTGRPSDNDF